MSHQFLIFFNTNKARGILGLAEEVVYPILALAVMTIGISLGYFHFDNEGAKCMTLMLYGAFVVCLATILKKHYPESLYVHVVFWVSVAFNFWRTLKFFMFAFPWFGWLLS